jgi:CarD family transcriptional regulator
MYQVGDQLVYGSHGVCRIVGEEKRRVDRKTVAYLVLEPIAQEGTKYYVPVHNEVAMNKLHPVLTPEEMERLLRSGEIRSVGWNRDENARKQSYRELISSGDRVALMRAVCSLYRHRKEQIQAGKKVHQADENFLRDAERVLAIEIGVVMNLPYNQALAYLQKELNAQ